MTIFFISFISGAVLSIIHLLYKWKKLGFPTELKLRPNFVITSSVIFGLFCSTIFVWGLLSSPGVIEIQHYLIVGLSFLSFPSMILREVIKQAIHSEESTFNIRQREVST